MPMNAKGKADWTYGQLTELSTDRIGENNFSQIFFAEVTQGA
jgi:hypothetical protein